MKGHHWFMIGLVIVAAYLLWKKGVIKTPAFATRGAAPSSGTEGM